MLSYANGSH